MAEQTVELEPSESKLVSFEFTPAEARTYEVSVNGLSGSFTAIAPAPPSGEILEITWYDEENDVWHPMSDPMAAYQEVTQRFRIRNTGSTLGVFKIGYCYWSDFQERYVWSYSPSFDIEPGEGNIDWHIYTGGAATFSATFYLFSDDTEVDTITVTIRVT